MTSDNSFKSGYRLGTLETLKFNVNNGIEMGFIDKQYGQQLLDIIENGIEATP